MVLLNKVGEEGDVVFTTKHQARQNNKSKHRSQFRVLLLHFADSESHDTIDEYAHYRCNNHVDGVFAGELCLRDMSHPVEVIHCEISKQCGYSQYPEPCSALGR